jgi:SHS2 domain-containing protein
VSYRFLPHTADALVEIEAPTREALLHDAVAAVRELLVAQSPVAAAEAGSIALTGVDVADLIFELLRELLYRFATDRFIPTRLELDQLSLARGGPAALAGTVFGERFDPERHETQPEVKAVTRHGLKVEETQDGFRAEILFDV